jgi:medium-chain acyl-[acyl-carrier-protein] hydrolase
MRSPQTYSYFVRLADADARARLGIVPLVDLMQDAAWRHAIELGASMETLQTQGVTWALSRLQLEIDHYPQLGEEVQIQTWPSGYQRSLVFRDFRFFGEQGRYLGRATTTWLVFDLVARKLVSLPEALRNRIPPAPAQSPMPRAAGNWAVPPFSDQAPPHPVHWWHLDLNQHVNHSHYLRWALTGLPATLPQEAHCQGVEITLRRECRLGEMARSVVQPISADTFSHALYRDSDGQLLMQMRTQWQPRR